MIVDNAIYVQGCRTEEPRSLEETYEAVRQRQGVVWIGLYKPTEEEFGSVAGEESRLHPLAVEDAVKAHQRPKLERYDEERLVVLRPARYFDETKTVEFGEAHLFVGEDFLVTVRHGEASELGKVRHRLEGDPELLRVGPEAILYADLDQMVDDYAPVVAGLENDIDKIETQVFSGNAGVSLAIYELSREVVEFQRATEPLPSILADRIGGTGDPELQRYLRDVQYHALRTTEQVGASARCYRAS
jgi:magnesium transporter